MDQKPLVELLLAEKGNWVIGYLDAIPQTPDEIAERAHLSVYAVVEGLVSLELRGEAKNVGDYRYIRVHHEHSSVQAPEGPTLF